MKAAFGEWSQLFVLPKAAWEWAQTRPYTKVGQRATRPIVNAKALIRLEKAAWSFEGRSSSQGSLFQGEQVSSKTDRPIKSLATSSDIDDLDAILNPAAHSLTLVSTTQRVIAQLDLESLFSIDNGVAQVRYIESMLVIRQALTRVLMAIQTLKNSGMCQGSINAIVEYPTRQDTAEVFEFDQSDISALLVLLGTHSPDIGATLTAYRELEEDVPEAIAPLLARPSNSLDHLIPPGGTKRWTWSYLCFFTAFATLATASYAGAHVHNGGSELLVDPVAFNSFVQRDPEFVEKFYSFRRRRLSCLDSFL